MGLPLYIDPSTGVRGFGRRPAPMGEPPSDGPQGAGAHPVQRADRLPDQSPSAGTPGSLPGDGSVHPQSASRQTADWPAAVCAHREDLLRLARRLVGDPGEAEDLTQAVLLRAMERESAFAKGTQLRSWLASILRNAFLDRMRARSRRPHTSLEGHEVANPPAAARHPSPWERVSIEDVHEALERLPTGQRELFTMFYLENQTYADIAKRTGLKKATVGTRLYRAKIAVRQLLTDKAGSRGGEDD